MPAELAGRTDQTHHQLYQVRLRQGCHLSDIIHKAMRRRDTQPWGLRGCLLLAVAGNLVVACGSPSTAASPTPTPRPSPTPTASTTATPDPQDAAVITGYLAATRAFVHAGSIPDPNDPALVATMTGEELSTVKKELLPAA